jgi:CheY-like chemotaxis protein
VRCRLPRELGDRAQNTETGTGVGETLTGWADGPSAFEVAIGFTPHVAIFDLGLPVTDGYELAARLRERLGQLQETAVELGIFNIGM